MRAVLRRLERSTADKWVKLMAGIELARRPGNPGLRKSFGGTSGTPPAMRVSSNGLISGS